MTFVEDIAVPSYYQINTEEITAVFDGQPMVANLEGPILEGYQETKCLNEEVLFNGSNQISLFQDMRIQLFNLANNHITDVPILFESICAQLRQNGIQFVEGGPSAEEAEKPATLYEEDWKYNFLTFGWETIQCIPANNGKFGINQLRPKHVFESIRKLKNSEPDSVLVILMHWNYELEAYPQPFERQLGRRCIDEGADAVVGCHNHCVQEIEIYKNHPLYIVWETGCYRITHILGGELHFPKRSYLQLTFEWKPGIEPKCHCFFYKPDNHHLNYLKSGKLDISEQINELTLYRDFNHKQYKN